MERTKLGQNCRGLTKRLPRRLSRWLTAFHGGVALGFLALWIRAALDGLLWRADFTAFYTGGAIVRQGLGPRLYDLALQTRIQQAILGPGRVFYDGVLPFNNPPHFALVMAPFSLLPLGVGYWLWAALQILLLALVLRRLTGMVSHWSRTDRWLLLSAFFAWFPLFLNILYGSLSLFLLLCWLEFYQALRRGDDFRAGIWLAPAAVKPQGALFLALVLLGGRRWRALVSAGIAGAAIVGVTAIAFGPSIWPDYLRWLAATSGYFDRFGVYPEGMINLKGTLTLLLGVERAPLIQTLSALALLIGSLGTLILWLRAGWEPGTAPFDLRLAWTLGLGALLSLHQNQQDCLTRSCPSFSCEAQCRMGRPIRPMALFLLSWPILFLVEEFALRGALHIRVPVILMVILLVWTWRLWRAEEKVRFPAGAGSS
ncbi:MAG: DUF2029 domain-containing protein [Thermoflexia bacterium]|nr:MAG: DUF2029 domain-containing protein [Thermoflexia bacterium]